MVSFDFGSFNWIAILVAGLAAWIVGAIWYSPPLFGRRWAATLGMKLEEGGNLAAILVSGLVISIVGAAFLRLFLGFAGATGLVDAILLALILWLAFIFLPNIPGTLFAKQSWKGLAIVQAEHAVAMAAMGAVLVSWT